MSHEIINKKTGICNQGNSHSSANYPYTVGNAKFKTLSETYLQRAFLDLLTTLKDNHLVIAPLPLFISHKDEINAHKKDGIFNIEPDWYVIYLGKHLIVEVDGLSHLNKSPQEEQDRLLPFDLNGVHILRIDSPEGDLTHEELREWARTNVENVIEYIKHKFVISGGRIR